MIAYTPGEQPRPIIELDDDDDFPPIPEAEWFDGLDEGDINECWGLGEDLDDLMSDWTEWLIKASFDPAEYRDWEACPYDPDDDDPGEDPYVTA